MILRAKVLVSYRGGVTKHLGSDLFSRSRYLDSQIVNSGTDPPSAE